MPRDTQMVAVLEGRCLREDDHEGRPHRNPARSDGFLGVDFSVDSLWRAALARRSFAEPQSVDFMNERVLPFQELTITTTCTATSDFPVATQPRHVLVHCSVPTLEPDG